jgi:hypothetical protein
MKCKCGNENAVYWFKIYPDEEWCDQCGSRMAVTIPDVYVDYKPELNLPDDPRTGKPPVFTSRQEKAKFLKEHHLVEVKDKEHGGPSLPSCEQPQNREQNIHGIRMILKNIREMGRDVRRQQFLKVLKTNGRI